MEVSAKDFGNMCQMFITTLGNIQKANDARCPEEVEELCKITKRHLILYREEKWQNFLTTKNLNANVDVV